MADIYNDLIKSDFSNTPNNELNNTVNNMDNSVSGLMAGLRAIGSLAFWASTSKDYTPDMAINDIRDLGEMLMTLPRLIQALDHIKANAEHEQQARKNSGVNGQ